MLSSNSFENVLYESVVSSAAKDKTLDDKFLRVESYFSHWDHLLLKVTLSTTNYREVTFEINSREFYSQKKNVLFNVENF